MDTTHLYEDFSKHPLVRIVDLFKTLTNSLGQFNTGDNAVVVDTLLCLSSEAIAAYSELWPAYKKVMLSAFYTRTILELLIWTKYCIRSRENAERFSNDSRRDIDGLRRMLKDFGELIGPNLSDMDAIKGMTPDVIKYASEIAKQRTFDTKYTRVGTAAEELGGEAAALYKNLNILLSKFTHPTALIVKNLFVGEAAEKMGAAHLEIGTFLMLHILLEIGNYLKTVNAG